jgi:hypothetical protein
LKAQAVAHAAPQQFCFSLVSFFAGKKNKKKSPNKKK